MTFFSHPPCHVELWDIWKEERLRPIVFPFPLSTLSFLRFLSSHIQKSLATLQVTHAYPVELPYHPFYPPFFSFLLSLFFFWWKGMCPFLSLSGGIRCRKPPVLFLALRQEDWVLRGNTKPFWNTGTGRRKRCVWLFFSSCYPLFSFAFYFYAVFTYTFINHTYVLFIFSLFMIIERSNSSRNKERGMERRGGCARDRGAPGNRHKSLNFPPLNFRPL